MVIFANIYMILNKYGSLKSSMFTCTYSSQTIGITYSILQSYLLSVQLLEYLHHYARGIGTLFAHTFSLVIIPLCCRAWRLSSLEKRSRRCRTWREGILVLVFKINKDVMSFFFPNHCSMCDWIYIYDHMFMLIIIVSNIALIIITLYFFASLKS